MKPIAFGHRKRVGKDTACRFLISYLRTTGSKKQINKGSFAYELKLMCHRLYGWDGLREPEFYEDPSNEHLREIALLTIGKSPREIWIEVGMGMRDVYDLTWVDALFYNNSESDILLISDCRFLNECQRIKEYGGLVVKIERPDIADTSDEADDALNGYDDWDHVIVNTDMDGFYEQIKEMVSKFEL